LKLEIGNLGEIKIEIGKNSTRAAQALAPRESMKAKFPISIFQFQRSVNG